MIDHHLVDQLKKLKLGGFTETLELRLSQAQKDELSHAAFLALVIQDEIERREARKLAVRIQKASFEEQKTLGGFDFSFNHKIKRGVVTDLATCLFVEKGEHVLLYGPAGVGKTHLAQSVARVALEKTPAAKVYFCPGDRFTNELIESIQEKNTAKFRRKYRNLQILVIDDIQFIAGKQTIQEEFFHTFNTIVSAGGQVILTSDRPPTEIKNLEDRLRSRFSGGLIVDIQEPDFELRTAILLIKAKEKEIELSIDAAKIIAEQVGDTRALEGALLSIYAKTLGRKEGIDLEDIEGFFQKKDERKQTRVTPHDIIKAVCSYYNVKQSQVKSALRAENVALPRQIIMFLLRRELRLKYEEIAYILKRKDHTTIIHGSEKISGMLIKNPAFKEEIDRITKSLILST
jgi:chromosomal replication initiator protein